MINTAELTFTIEGFMPNQTYPQLLREIFARTCAKRITPEEATGLRKKCSDMYSAKLKELTR